MNYKGFNIEPVTLDQIQIDDQLESYVAIGQRAVFKINHLTSGLFFGYISSVEAAKKRIDQWAKRFPPVGD